MEAFLTLMVAWLIFFLATRKSSSHRGMSQYEKDRIRRANSNKKIILSILLAFVAITADAQFLFRISGNRLKEPSYMLGTIHYLPGSLLDNSIEYMEAEAQCQQMYVEHKITYKRIAAAQQKQEQPTVTYQDGKNIFDLIDAQSATILKEKLKEVMSRRGRY